MKLIKKIICYSLVLLLCLLTLASLLLYVSADTTSYLTRLAFASGAGYAHHPQYEERISNIQIEKDLSYAQDDLAVFDLYYPTDTSQTYPLLIWVHGGAFVGGDKQDCEGFLTMLASEGYVVANMNYELAPEITYPQPIHAINALALQLQTSTNYPIDQQRIFIGGDSAGANLAGQFVTIQMNEQYSTDMEIQAIYQPQQMKGYLSFCGLLDLTSYDETDSWFSNFLFKQSAISYFQTRSWKTSTMAAQANFLEHIEAFPSVYLTDGSYHSFQPQAEAAIKLLQRKQIEVTSLFFDQSKLPHEYQFQLDLKEAQENYDHVVSFLRSHS